VFSAKTEVSQGHYAEFPRKHTCAFVKYVRATVKVGYEFFQQLLERCRPRSTLFSNVSPVGYQNWVNAGAGKSGLMWTFCAMGREARVELFFCASDAEVNRKRYDAFLARKDEIEKAFGEPLFWDFKEGRKQQYIKARCPLGGMDQEARWKEIQNDLIERLIKLESTLRNTIKQVD
jgi:hypothetical protein